MKYRSLFFKIIRYSGIPFILRSLFQRKNVTVLMYHDTIPDIFEQHMLYVQKHFNIIELSELIKAIRAHDFSLLPKYPLLVVFDDGHKNNYNLLPLFKKFEIKPVIFLVTSKITTSRHYWFKEVSEKEELLSLMRLPDSERLKVLKERYGYEDNKEYLDRHTLSKNEIMEMIPHVNFESHSVTHPCLDKCSVEKSFYEIDFSREFLKKEFGITSTAFAYPNGDYTSREAEFVKKAGYDCGFTVEPGFNNENTDSFRLKRISATDNSEFNEFVVKLSGFWWFLKFMLKK